MNDPIRFFVPGIPKGQPRHRTRVQHTNAGKAYAQEYPDPEGAERRGAIQYHAKMVMRARPMMEGPLMFNLLVLMQVPESWSDRKKQQAYQGFVKPMTTPDNDNLEKLYWDALSGICYADDKAITTNSTRKRYGIKPGVMVEILSDVMVAVDVKGTLTEVIPQLPLPIQSSAAVPLTEAAEHRATPF